MRLVHPTTRSAARAEWGRRHNALIVSGPFWAATILFAVVVGIWVHVTAPPDTTTQTVPGQVATPSAGPTPRAHATGSKPAQVANPAVPNGEPAAPNGDGGLPLVAIGLAGIFTLAAGVGLVVAKSRRSSWRLQRQVDALGGDVDWQPRRRAAADAGDGGDADGDVDGEGSGEAETPVHVGDWRTDDD